MYTNFIEAKNNDGIKSPLKAAFSEDLVTNLLNIYFPEDSLIYDPFMGISTTARACIKSNRDYIGSEINETIYNEGLKTIENL
jgi:DNA modification methylase